MNKLESDKFRCSDCTWVQSRSRAVKLFFILFALSSTCYSETSGKVCSAESLKEWTFKAASEIHNKGEYPDVARMYRMQGRGLVLVSAEKSGKIIDRVVTKSTGFRVLDEAMLDAVSGAKIPEVECDPDGVLKFAVPFTFKLD